MIVYVLFCYKLFRYKFELLTVHPLPGNWRTLSHWKKGASMASKVVVKAR
jgi:hypothetical protein